MSDLAVYTSSSVVAVDHQTQAVQRLTEWAHSAQAAMAVAGELSRSAFVPEAFRGKPAECTAAILAGLEVGLQPMAALRSFDVIQGQAAPRAITQRAVAQSHGHEIELVESTATRCKMRGRRRGSSAWQEVTWTIDRAKQLKLTGKPNWQNQPQAMLVARATSEIARLVASDALLGIAYGAEELADGAGAGVEVPAVTGSAEAATSGTRRMSRAKPAEASPQAADDAITAAQMRKLQAGFGDIGMTDRADRLTFVAVVVGRDVETSKDLSVSEASAVIDAVERVASGTARVEFTADGGLVLVDGVDVETGEIVHDAEVVES